MLMSSSGAIPPEKVEEYAAQAERLAAEIKLHDGDLEPAYQALDKAIQAMEREGIALESLVPADSDFALGFAAPADRTGEGFWKKYRGAIKKRICNPHSEIYKKVAAGGSVGTGSLIGLILSHLGLPEAAIPIAAAVAGILSGAGLDAICKEEHPVRPSKPRRKTS
jgi:hypothetical protein